MEARQPTWLFRNVFQVGDGGFELRGGIRRADFRDSGLHRLLGRLRQHFVGGNERSNTEGDRGVAVPAVQDCAAVDGQQVTGGQCLAGGRDAMHDADVDR